MKAYWKGILAVAAIVTQSGCVGPHASSIVRERSFSQHTEAVIRGENAAGFISSRYLILIPSGEVTIQEPTPESPGFRFSSSTAEGISSATAIDSRGYILTAAHCLGESDPTVVFVDNGRLRSERGRVVWRGDKSGEGIDLALIAIRSPLPKSFEWSTEVADGQPVISLGPSERALADQDKGELEPMAGKISGMSKKANSRGSVRIGHTVPVHPGDSGAPLVNLDGHLVGIMVNAVHVFEWYIKLPLLPRGYAYRPDITWLNKAIDDDYRKITSPRTSSRHIPKPPPPHAARMPGIDETTLVGSSTSQ